MNKFADWIKGFAPEPISINYTERLRACTGALVGILLTGLVTYLIEGNAETLPYLIAPIGASAVLLFAVPSSPLAQPWSIIGGNISAALVGVTCALWISNLAVAAAFAVGISIAVMFALRCLHPPSGAVALTAVLGGPSIIEQGYGFVLSPVAINSLLLLGVALIFNNITRRPYPHAVKVLDSHQTKDIPPEMRFGFTPEDLNEVLKQYNQVLDVSRDDLQTLLQQTEMHAYRRRFGEITCADIMSKDVVSVEFGTELEDAWALLRKHKIKALPVIDRARRVIGIITQIDFMKNADLEVYEGFETKLKRFIKTTTSLYSEKPEVAGQIMSSPAVTANLNMHIIELIPLMTQQRVHHHIPVVDDNRRLVGIVTQSDLVSALYHGRIANTRTLGLSS
ncbi:MAG: HPP family protein [Pseudomonadota bacterium]